MEDHLEKGSPIEQQIIIPLNDGNHPKGPREEGDEARFSVILRDLSFHCREEHLQRLFETYYIDYLHLIVRRTREGRSLLHAFVDFQSLEEALRVQTLFNGLKWKGRTMKVELCDRNRNHVKGDTPGFEIHAQYYSITHHPQIRVTEEVLENIFLPFGHISDIIIRNHTEEVNEGRVIQQHGFAFIYFTHWQSALNADKERERIFYDIQFDVELSYKTKGLLGLLQQSLPASPPQPPVIPIRKNMELTAGNNFITHSLPYEYQYFYSYTPPLPFYQPGVSQLQPPSYTVFPPNYHPLQAAVSQPFPNQQSFPNQLSPITQYPYQLPALNMHQNQYSITSEKF